MRVGIDIGKGLGRLDGIGRYVRSLVAALAEVDRENHYLLYPMVEPPPEWRFEEVFPDAPKNFRPAPARAPEDGDVDLFHATAFGVPRRFTGPLVFTVHDLTFLSHPHLHTVENRLHCLAGLARAVCRGARFLAVSRHTAADCERLAGIAAGRIEVVPNAADPSFRPVEPAAARRRVAERFGIAEPYVLTVGTLEPRKNLGALIAAFAALPAELRDAHRLVVAGGAGWLGRDPEETARGAEAAGIGGRVTVLGHVADDELPALYSGAAAFVYPSLYEGFGLPALEALACGAPAVVSDTSSLPEVVGEAAVRVDPTDVGALRDGLAAVLADGGLSARLRAEGPRRAAGFSWRRTAEATARIYRDHAAGASAT